MPTIQKGHRGAHNELLATVWLLKCGWAVFRNVAEHGPVDIIGMKDGEITLFDVKQAYMNAAGERSRIRLSPEQIAAGVKGIAVFADGRCQIDWSPIATNFENLTHRCPTCESDFRPTTGSQEFCSLVCRPSHVPRKKLKKAKNGAVP